MIKKTLFIAVIATLGLLSACQEFLENKNIPDQNKPTITNDHNYFSFLEFARERNTNYEQGLNFSSDSVEVGFVLANYDIGTADIVITNQDSTRTFRQLLNREVLVLDTIDFVPSRVYIRLSNLSADVEVGINAIR